MGTEQVLLDPRLGHHIGNCKVELTAAPAAVPPEKRHSKVVLLENRIKSLEKNIGADHSYMVRAKARPDSVSKKKIFGIRFICSNTLVDKSVFGTLDQELVTT